VVGHAEGEYGRDDDGGGVGEAHMDTMEGLWTGARNPPRASCGVNKNDPYAFTDRG
jgi:hypothetical protein